MTVAVPSVPVGYTPSDTARRLIEGPKSAALPEAVSFAVRSPFARDRARVLHSASFRRLAGKTQVVGPDEADVPRTRLTHSLEVAQIAREIGEQLGCDPDLTDLAGLAHDIGHPPFGHNGERALNEAAAGIGGFEANAQNLRLLGRLEAKSVDPEGRPYGLNLTRAALDAVLKYPWVRGGADPASGAAAHKFGVYSDDLELFEWVRDGAPVGRRCIEAQVMDWADDVAYSVHDVEDGIHSGRIDLSRLYDPEEQEQVCAAAGRGYSAESPDDLREVLADLLALPVVRAVSWLRTGAGDELRGESALKQMTSELTGRFATGAAAATRAKFGDARMCRYSADLVVPRLLGAEVAVLKAIALRYVMDDPKRRALQAVQRERLTELVTMTAATPESLDAGFRIRHAAAADDAARLRAVIDQVSLLTDAQATARWARLTGRAWT
ncbi:deoxyguanosinetriphosphate triphosphohydrolase [Nakamurella silvestris]|nr:deoxyguanosinetriphosphate triphosphohydrolase [Nakamurella silvestris]